MSKEICSDITVVGAGVAGLMTATRLSEKGYSVAVIDKAPQVCSGSSVRNEGWLHAGTYHATSIKDRQKAIEVAKRCQYGKSVLQELAPAAIREPDIHSYAVFKTDEYVEFAQERWDAADVLYASVLIRELSKYCPEIDTTPLNAAFRVADVSIHTPTLYANLISRIQENSGNFYLESTVVVDENQQAWLRSKNFTQAIPLNSQLIINTTGYGMSDFLSQYFGEEYSMRFWKSHLIVYPRLGKHNIFYIEPGEAAAIQHEAVTMVGQHEDAIAIDTPDFSPMAKRANSVIDATNRLYKNSHTIPHLITACLKPDLSSLGTTARSVSVDIHEPQPGFIFALPGKMTESPCLADKLVEIVESRSIKKSKTTGCSKLIVPIAPRPCDTWK